MAKNDDEFTNIVDSAQSEFRKAIKRLDEIDTASKAGHLSDFLRASEETKVRPFVARAFTIIFVFLVFCSIVSVIYSVWLPVAQGDILIDRVLKVNQAIIPIVTLVIGFYFGASRPR